MTSDQNTATADEWFGQRVLPGEAHDLELPVGETFSSSGIHIPIHVRRGPDPGPTLFVTAALHGDEINGSGAVRELLQDSGLILEKGTLILVPVLNILAFERHSRYMPDRRDLNRCFPGSSEGSLASRMANRIFNEIVRRADFGIDLHTAAVRRTNYPNVRADLSLPEVRRLATAFGSEIIINGKGPDKALRREACKAGCPTIIMEGGEVWKVEPSILDVACHGVRNILRFLGMTHGTARKPGVQFIIETTKWIRAENGGFIQFHVQPGEIVDKDQPLATNTTLLGERLGTLVAPFNGIIIGMTSLPAVAPGEPVFHLGELPADASMERLRDQRSGRRGLTQRLADDLATNVHVVDHEAGEAET